MITLREMLNARAEDYERQVQAVRELLDETNQVIECPSVWIEGPPLTRWERFYFWILRRFN